jgi:hypothetical protein
VVRQRQAEFFDVGQSRSIPWLRRPRAAALLAALRDPNRGFDAVVIGEPHRAFYGNQFGLTFPHQELDQRLQDRRVRGETGWPTTLTWPPRSASGPWYGRAARRPRRVSCATAARGPRW